MQKNKITRALLLDRDGVLIEDYGHIGKVENVEIIRDIIPALQWIAQKNIPIFVLTNQSGVARGYYSLADCDRVNNHIASLLQKSGVEIVKWYICPHHETDGKGEFLKKCNCRKPHPEMALKIQEEFGIDFTKSLMVGDKVSDVLEIDALKTILLKGRYQLGPVRDNVVITDHKGLLEQFKKSFS